MRSIKHTETFRIDQPAEIVFPLFTPEGEKKWVPGWDYEGITESDQIHEDYIFSTKTHDHASSDAIWLVKRFEPASYFVQLYKIEPQDKVGIVTIQCVRQDDNATQVEVSYEYTAISEKGAQFIAAFTPDQYKAFIGEWKRLLEHYFQSPIP